MERPSPLRYAVRQARPHLNVFQGFGQNPILSPIRIILFFVTFAAGMCLFSVIFQSIPGGPVFVLANREESPDRPSSPPAIRACQNTMGVWLGGTDLQAGGTWLGINAAGVVAAVTNRRKSFLPSDPKSRGLLCRELLEQGSLEKAEAEFHRQWKTEQFAGFNLMLISAERGIVVSSADDLHIQPLTAGHHAITNGDWDDPRDRRIRRVLGMTRAFQKLNPSVEEWITHAKHICRLGEEAGRDAVCIPCTQGWGTVSSSVMALTDDPGKARYLHAAGSPDVTAFADHSAPLLALLKGSA